MQADPISQMVASVTQRGRQAAHGGSTRGAQAQAHEGKAAKMRQALQAGPQYAAALGAAAGVPAARVQPCLKHDLAVGRVVTVRCGGRRLLYALGEGHAAADAARVAEAVALLRRRGFQVRERAEPDARANARP